MSASENFLSQHGWGDDLISTEKKSSADLQFVSDTIKGCHLLLVRELEVLPSLAPDRLLDPLEVFIFSRPLDKLLCVDCVDSSDGFVA